MKIMNHKIIRLAGRSYVISGFTPSTTKRVITTLRELNVQELKDIPDAVPVMVDVISIAISGSGVFSRFKDLFIRRRLINHAKIENLLEATETIIGMIPADEFYTVSSITNQFKKAIVK